MVINPFYVYTFLVKRYGRLGLKDKKCIIETVNKTVKKTKLRQHQSDCKMHNRIISDVQYSKQRKRAVISRRVTRVRKMINKIRMNNDNNNRGNLPYIFTNQVELNLF